MLIAELTVPTRDALGESVLWSASDRAVYWIDGYAPCLHRFDPVTQVHRTQHLTYPAPVGMVARAAQGNDFIVAHAAGLARFDSVSAESVFLAHPEAGRAGIFYNDGKADRDGRLWFGTFDEPAVEPRGIFWRAGPAPVAVDAGFAVFNGPAFSPDGTTAYVSDSMARRILAYDVHSEAPYLTNRRIFAALTDNEGLPDGLTVDADGGLWCAMWGGSRVTRFDPAGNRTTVVQVAAAQVTSVAFGGAGLDTLYITSARCDLDEETLLQTPAAGGLFSVVPGVSGLPETPVIWDSSKAGDDR